MAAKKSRKKRMRRMKAYATRFAFAFLIACAVALSGFGVVTLVQRFQPGESAAGEGDIIEVRKDGTIYGYIEEDFSKEYYDVNGLKAMIEEEIAEYARVAGSQTCVELKDFKVDQGTADVLIVYESAEDYRSYNNKILYTGKVSELSQGGVSFDMPLLSAEEEGETLQAGSISSIGDYQAVVFDEKVSVAVPDKILYHSGNVSLTGKKTAVADGDSTESAVIIYK